MKKPIFFMVSLFLIGALVSVSFTVPVLGHSGSSDAFTATYDVTKSNETALYTWFNSDYSESYNYTVEQGSEIEVEIYDLTDPQTEMNITLGNLSRNHIFDNEANGNLGLGYWNLNETFGFVANTDWEGVEANFSDQAFTSSSFDANAEYTFGASSFSAVNVTFADAFQSTNLVYNEASGILYHAEVIIGNFVLSFDINGLVPQEDDEPTDEETPVSHLAIIAALSSLVLIARFRRNQ